LLHLVGDEDEAFVAYRGMPQPAAAVLWLSGVDGGLDGPFDGFYSLMAEQLQNVGLASAQLLYRSPGEFEASVREALLALAFLEQEGVQDVALVGFSFGGAVAIEAAAAHHRVATVVTLGSQEFGTDRVAEIAPRPLLVVHAAGDEVMPVSVAWSIYERAGPDKKLVVLPTSDHYLTDAASRVERLIQRWLLRNVAPPAEPQEGQA
jgi:alpha/beta superfamily hydrolase